MRHYINSIYYEIELTGKYFRLLGTQLFERLKLDITVDEFIVLDTIHCNEGICQRDLAKLILRDRANTGRILNSLEEKQLLKRFIDTKNNRLVKRMELTDRGIKVLEQGSIRVEESCDNLVKKVSESEIEKIKTTLKNFRELLIDAVKLEI